MSSATVTFCTLHRDVLTLICNAIDDGYIFNKRFSRPSVRALSETCKDLRAIAAPIVFRTLAIWDWDKFVETAQSMVGSELARRYTRTLRVTPVLVRRLSALSERPEWEAIRNDPYLPRAGRNARSNSTLYYGDREDGAPEPDTAYMPLARIEGGTQANVTSEAEALRDLLLGFDNLTELVFGLGSDASHRPPFEEAICHAFGKTQLPTVQMLNLEDTALFWTGICAQAHDLTVSLGYSSGAPGWPSAPAVRKLKLHHTSFCHAAGQDHYSEMPPETDGIMNNCGPVITKAMPYIKTLNIADCGGDFETVLSSLSGFTQLEDLHVHAALSRLNVGLEPPPFRCGTGEHERWQMMSEEERTAELEQRKREHEIEIMTKQRALDSVKRVVLKHFPALTRFRLARQICYDFSTLGARNLHEIDKLKPSPAVDLDNVW